MAHFLRIDAAATHVRQEETLRFREPKHNFHIIFDAGFKVSGLEAQMRPDSPERPLSTRHFTGDDEPQSIEDHLGRVEA